MDPEDAILTAARNAPEPPFPYDDDLTGKASSVLKREVERKKALLQKSHSAREGAQFKRIIVSCRYHVELNTAVRGFYERTLFPLRNERSKWGDKPVQLSVIKLIKKMWTKHKLPMHISFFKLYNMWVNKSFKDMKAKVAKDEAKAEAKAGKAGKSKRSIEEVEDSEEEDLEQPGKRARLDKSLVKAAALTKKVSKAKTTSPRSKNTKPAGKNEAQAKPKSTNKDKALRQPPRVGSDGVSLRIGSCRLGHDEDQLAQGTIISLSPKMSDVDIEGNKMSWPWNDGVLCRFVGPLKGKATSSLVGSVVSVCTC